MKKIAFVFPGQGQQYIGMGKELSENFKAASDVFDAAGASLGRDMRTLIFEGSDEELKKTENTQPAIVTASIAVCKVLEEKGIKPDVTLGLSLGEYSALVAAGVISLEDAVKVVEKRGKFMQEAVPAGVGAMAAVLGLDNNLVEKACDDAFDAGYVKPANYNCPGQLVIAGEVKAVERASELAKEYGAKKVVMLPVSAPFHTKMLESAGDKLREVLENTKLNDFTVPLVSNVDANYTTEKEVLIDKLVSQVSNSVLWEMSVRRLVDDGFDTFVEVGPGNALSKFIKKISKDVTVLNVEDLASLEKTLEVLKVEA